MLRVYGKLCALLAIMFLLEQPRATQAILKRCVSCRSRGELGSCKDPFKMNSSQIENEKGVEAVPCASGWCVKIIESPNLNNGKANAMGLFKTAESVEHARSYNSRGGQVPTNKTSTFLWGCESLNSSQEYGTATERSCLQRGPDDNEERCAYTKWNYKNVYMCFCNGDLCNSTTKMPTSLTLYLLALVCATIRWLTH